MQAKNKIEQDLYAGTEITGREKHRTQVYHSPHLKTFLISKNEFWGNKPARDCLCEQFDAFPNCEAISV